MLLQTLPAQVQAEEKVNTTVMVSEGQQAAQTPNGSETQYNGTTSENESGKIIQMRQAQSSRMMHREIIRNPKQKKISGRMNLIKTTLI